MQKYDIPKGYPTHTELLKDDEIDAVRRRPRATSSTTASQSTPATSASTSSSKKPMALSLQQCDDMIEAGRQQQRQAHGRARPSTTTEHSLKAKEILDSGQLGPLMTIICYMSKNWNYASRPPQYRSRFHGGGMWLANGVPRRRPPHLADGLAGRLRLRQHGQPAPTTRPATTPPPRSSATRTAWPASPSRSDSPTVRPTTRARSSAPTAPCASASTAKSSSE